MINFLTDFIIIMLGGITVFTMALIIFGEIWLLSLIGCLIIQNIKEAFQKSDNKTLDK